MDIDEIRRTNLRALESKMGASAICKLTEMSPTQFYNLRNGAKDSKTGKRRGMRKETAWKFEDAVGLPRGYLDTLHDDQAADQPNALAVLTPPNLRQTLERLAYFIGEAPPQVREVIGPMLDHLALNPHNQGLIDNIMPWFKVEPD